MLRRAIIEYDLDDPDAGDTVELQDILDGGLTVTVLDIVGVDEPLVWGRSERF